MRDTVVGHDPSTFDVITTWYDDGLLPSEGGCNHRLNIVITDVGSEWELGLADTSAEGGWLGEDCLSGEGYFDICHPLDHAGSLFQVSTCTPWSIVPGESTLFDASREPALTYYLSDGFACFVWGRDPAYYAALGCGEHP